MARRDEDEMLSSAAVGEEVAMLRKEVAGMAEELLMHRKVLDQCLEVRESVLELLEHREALVQCLALREGVEAALGSTQIIGEIADRTCELDLSLAGVSDNTARHGRAISSLTEQQKRTSATLDAVVRAVKRLDRSRSRPRSGTASLAAQTNTPTVETCKAWMEHPGFEGILRAGSGGGDGRAMDAWMDGELEGQYGVGFGGACVAGHPAEDDPWFWSSWGGDLSDRVLGANRQAFEGRRDWRGKPPSSNHSSRGRASWRATAVAAEAAADSAKCAFGTPPRAGLEQHDQQPPGTAASAEVADCVQGVLARINEALGKLDGPADHEDPRNGMGIEKRPRPRAPVDGWEAAAAAQAGAEAAARAEQQQQQQRPGSAHGARRPAGAAGQAPIAVTSRAGAGYTSARHHDGASTPPQPAAANWRAADSWA
eukprot:TRINITY_DN74270_c0_g1_i1.p1 TRINITY_DN74270_c0_g1~~TRINITY_DN74270_c0_g1_i1.p1  ORF type:complete len:427 (-),score=92.63 TRINITY_DN74270_c0_g1_i1:636-1916(-)